MSDRATRTVLLAVADLFFVAKIRTAAAHLGVEAPLTAAATLVDDCHALRPDLVIADLHAHGILDAVRALRRDPSLAALPVSGFYSHVDDETRRAALEAGVDRVMPRSAFTVRLAAILAGTDDTPP